MTVASALSTQHPALAPQHPAPPSPIAHRVGLAEGGVLDEGAVDLEVAAHDVVRLQEAAAEVERFSSARCVDSRASPKMAAAFVHGKSLENNRNLLTL